MKQVLAGSKKVQRPFDVSHERLEFLSDGIFAIAMTVLVLDLKVPIIEDPRSIHQLFDALAHHGATFASYLLSFFMLGFFWYKHDRQFRFIQRVGLGVFVTQLILLAVSAFFPFSAALLGHYPSNTGSVFIYLSTIFVYVAVSTAQWVLARRSSAIVPSLEASEIAQLSRRNLRRTLLLGSLTLLYAGITLMRM
jgi:uncharacterized membrane protein